MSGPCCIRKNSNSRNFICLTLPPPTKYEISRPSPVDVSLPVPRPWTWFSQQSVLRRFFLWATTLSLADVGLLQLTRAELDRLILNVYVPSRPPLLLVIVCAVPVSGFGGEDRAPECFLFSFQVCLGFGQIPQRITVNESVLPGGGAYLVLAPLDSSGFTGMSSFRMFVHPLFSSTSDSCPMTWGFFL